MKALLGGLWVTGGTASLILGIVGILVPLLPTTPFLLLASFCFARGSPRIHDQLTNHRLWRGALRNFRMGSGIRMRNMVIALAALWLAIGGAALWFVPEWWG
jgi:hypothetical protein